MLRLTREANRAGMISVEVFVTTPSSRVNAQAVALSCGLFLTCGRNEKLTITLLRTYIQNYRQEQIGNNVFSALGILVSSWISQD